MLESLKITNLRNLRAVALDGLQRHNILHGKNGSGKTSVLEAVHMLGTARSFRNGAPKTLITHGEPCCVVYGEKRVDGGGHRALGVQREIRGELSIRVGGESVRSVAKLADELPLLLINSDSFDLLVGEPGRRRRFLDWGAFHVEQDFRDAWRRFQRALSQRNHLLRHGKLTDTELDAWSRDVAINGQAVSTGRERFLAAVQPVVHRLLSRLAPEIGEVTLSYRRGWDSSLTYEQALQRALRSDREQGFTQSGPQRGDIRVLTDGYAAADTLSRGQQKLLVCALKLAQGEVFASSHAGAGLYLIDDLPSELDSERCERICRCLGEMAAQSMITCVDPQAIPAEWLGDRQAVAMFHVEQGSVNASHGNPGAEYPEMK